MTGAGWQRLIAPLAHGLAWGLDPQVALGRIADAFEQARPRSTEAAVARRLQHRVRAGEPLGLLMVREGAPPSLVHLVRAGEESNDLRSAGRGLLRLRNVERRLRGGVFIALFVPVFTVGFCISSLYAIRRVFATTGPALDTQVLVLSGLQLLAWALLGTFAFIIAVAALGGVRGWMSRIPGVSSLAGARAASELARQLTARIAAEQEFGAALRDLGLERSALAVDGGVAPVDALSRHVFGRWWRPWIAGADGTTLGGALARAADALEIEADARQRAAIAWLGHIAVAAVATLAGAILYVAYGGLGGWAGTFVP